MNKLIISNVHIRFKFHPLYTTDEKFALDLLPFNTSYDSSKKVLTQIPRSRFEEDIILQCE